MAKYLKLFNLESEYTAYKNSSDFVLPNVSYITETKDIKYSAVVLPTYTISATFGIEGADINQDVKILNNTTGVKAISIDGIKQSNVQTTAKFTTQGTHTVTYTVDTTVMNNWFEGCSNIVEFDITGMTEVGENAFAGCNLLHIITIPDTVTIIRKNAFMDCSGLSLLYIGENVTNIESNAFRGCANIDAIYSYPMVPPVIDSSTFDLYGEGPQPRRFIVNKVLEVPVGSDYSVWMSSEPYYLGCYNFVISHVL